MDLAAGTAPAQRRHEIPAQIAALIGEPDYTDIYALAVPGPDRWSPETWARTICDDVAGGAGQFVWRGLLGLRLSPRDPGRVAGWAIDGRGEGWIRLAASGRRMDGLLVVSVGADEVSLTTAVRFHGSAGRWVWARLSSTHRRLAPGLLGDAYTALESGGTDHSP